MYKIFVLPKNSIGDYMKKMGITRRIDDLGRIVIPKEIRKNLKMRESDEIEISVIDDKIVLNKYESLRKDKLVSTLLRTLGKYLNKNVLFTSRERIIDYYVKGKDNLESKELDIKIVNIIESRKMVFSEVSSFYLFNIKEDISYVIWPLIINGDLLGSLIVYSNENIIKDEMKVIEMSKIFLENYLE